MECLPHACLLRHGGALLCVCLSTSFVWCELVHQEREEREKPNQLTTPDNTPRFPLSTNRRCATRPSGSSTSSTRATPTRCVRTFLNHSVCVRACLHPLLARKKLAKYTRASPALSPLDYIKEKRREKPINPPCHTLQTSPGDSGPPRGLSAQEPGGPQIPHVQPQQGAGDGMWVHACMCICV